MDAYKVERERGDCEHCGGPGLWWVVGPDGIAGGTSFTEEADADEHAGLLNTVRAAAHKEIVDECGVEYNGHADYVVLQMSRDMWNEIRAAKDAPEGAR